MLLYTTHFVWHLHTMKPSEYYTATGTDTQVKTKHDFTILLRHTRSVFFWDFTQQSGSFLSTFGTTYQSHLQGSSSDTLVQNYHSTLHKIPKRVQISSQNKVFNPSQAQTLLPLMSHFMSITWHPLTTLRWNRIWWQY